MKKVFQALGAPANVYSDDGSEFKREFKELMSFWNIEKQVPGATPTLRSASSAPSKEGHVALHSGRSGPAGAVAPYAGRRLKEARYHAVALHNIGRRAKHKVTRPEIKVGNMVRIRVKPIESRGSYRVNKIAWSKKVYRVVSAKSGKMGARFGLEGWPEKVVHRNLRKV